MRQWTSAVPNQCFDMSQRFIGVFLLGFFLGVLARSFWGFGWQICLAFALLGLFFLAFSFLGEQKRTFLFIALILLGASLGSLRYIAEEKAPAPALAELDGKVGKEIKLKAIVLGEPERKENYSRFPVEPEEYKGIKILVYAGPYSEYKYGDELLIRGKLERPENFSQGFDWISYLAKDDIYYQIFYPKIKKIGEGKGNSVKQFLFSIKEKYLSSLGRLLPEPHASLAGGITVGAKRSLGEGWLGAFRRTGIIHIVVLSGYNLSLVSDVGMKALSFLPKAAGFSIGAIGIILFALMVGASPSVARASIMALLIVFARASGRVYEAGWALFLAAFLMVFYNPKVLVYDAGFQLSFMATFALIYFAPAVERRLSFLPKRWKIREIVSSTLAVQGFVFPWILYKMGVFSLSAPLVNILILPLIPFAMLFSFLAGAAGILGQAFAFPFGWLAYFILQYCLSVVKFFDSLPFSSLTANNFPLLLTTLIYLSLAFILIYNHLAKDKSTL